jgi:putative lipoprotein
VESNINLLLESYKNRVKYDFIYKAPMKAFAYFALFQTVVIGNQETLIFNPRNNKEDNKVYAAVATSWDTYYPKAERGLNLHNIAIQGMKDVRIIQAEQQKDQIDASKVKESGIIDIALPDNKGHVRRLSDLAGKVVMLDFHVFANENSLKRIMMLRELYNKYHAQGFEIYQVSIDPDEHFWKTQTAALPWISVHDDAGVNSPTLSQYNVQQIPTYFLIGKDNSVRMRDVQVKDIDAAIKSLL